MSNTNISSASSKQISPELESLNINEKKIPFFPPTFGKRPIAIAPPISAYYSKLRKEEQWNKIEPHTPEGQLLKDTLRLHDQIQKKLAEVTPSFNETINQSLHSAHQEAQKVLEEFNKPHPSLQIIELHFQAASSFYQSAISHADNPKRSEISLGLASSFRSTAEEMEKKNVNTDIIESGYCASGNFQEAITLLDKAFLEPTKLEQEKKLKQAHYHYLAGNVLLQCIKEELKPDSEFNSQAASYFTASCTGYEKASQAMAANNITKGLYHFHAGSAYEELAKEELKPLTPSPEAQNRSFEIKNCFLQAVSSFTGAFVMFDSDPEKATHNATIGKNYFSLAKEYQKPEPNEEVIQSLKKQLSDLPEEIGKTASLVREKVKK